MKGPEAYVCAKTLKLQPMLNLDRCQESGLCGRGSA